MTKQPSGPPSGNKTFIERAKQAGISPLPNKSFGNDGSTQPLSTGSPGNSANSQQSAFDELTPTDKGQGLERRVITEIRIFAFIFFLHIALVAGFFVSFEFFRTFSGRTLLLAYWMLSIFTTTFYFLRLLDSLLVKSRKPKVK